MLKEISESSDVSLVYELRDELPSLKSHAFLVPG